MVAARGVGLGVGVKGIAVIDLTADWMLIITAVTGGSTGEFINHQIVIHGVFYICLDEYDGDDLSKQHNSVHFIISSGSISLSLQPQTQSHLVIIIIIIFLPPLGCRASPPRL